MKTLVWLALLAVPMAAQAVQITSTTSSYVTFRDCVTFGITACDSISPILYGAVDGNPGDQHASASLSDSSYGKAKGSVTSLAGKRNSSNEYILQRYTYTGASATTLAFDGLLSFDQTVPAENGGFDPNNAAAVFSGAFAALQIFTLADDFLEAGISALDNFNALSGGYASAPGYTLLASTNNGTLSNVTGSGSQALSLSVNLNPNDSVWLYAALQTPTANGATVKAKFVTSTNVPEPGTLALLSLGLGLLALARFRKAAIALRSE